MSHSRIYQISASPISPDDYATAGTYEDSSDDFADYIGDEFTGEDRDGYIENFGRIISPVFTAKGDGVFCYKGAEALREFKQAWCDELMRKAAELTPDNLFKNQRLFCISQLIEKTHLDVSSRVDIKGWCEGTAFPFGELFEWAESRLKEGDLIYIGAVIDYHF